MSDQPHLLTERRGHVLVVTMNRPEAKNALSSEMLARMYDAWVELSEDPELRVGILTGAGGTFCSGMDLKAFATGFQETEWTKRFQEDDDLHWKALLRHYRPTKPLIAAVEGYALAGGTEILQATELRVAGESAVFGITEVARGLFPLGGSTVRLRRQIPFTLAAELLLTGRRVPAREALDIGLIGHVVPDGTAVDKAMELAEVIAENAPLSVQAVLRSLRESGEMTEAEGLANELTLGWPIFATEDAKEGATAFKEKRKASFKGR
jgi:enoyl-CoA hydratase